LYGATSLHQAAAPPSSLTSEASDFIRAQPGFIYFGSAFFLLLRQTDIEKLCFLCYSEIVKRQIGT
jgi:hypothetical protein